MELQEAKSVHVTNISPNANEKTVSDFFSFCGKINKLFMKKEEGQETFSAVVQFETESAAKTALLLTNALIVDRPINVAPFSQPANMAPEAQQEQLGTQVNSEDITQRDFRVPDEDRSKTSVIASLIAAGYGVGQDALVKAKEFDEKHMITLQAKVAVEQIKVKAHEIDKQYGISEKAANLGKQINDTAKQIDNDYHVSERANAAATSIRTTATTAFSKAQEYPTVARGLNFMKDTSSKLNTAVKNFEEETKKAIEERERTRSGSITTIQSSDQPLDQTGSAETQDSQTPTQTDSNPNPTPTDPNPQQ